MTPSASTGRKERWDVGLPRAARAEDARTEREVKIKLPVALIGRLYEEKILYGTPMCDFIQAAVEQRLAAMKEERARSRSAGRQA